MSTFLIDWGKDANGGRFGLVEGNSEKEAWWYADAIGGPFKIAKLKIRRNKNSGYKYLELAGRDDVFGDGDFSCIDDLEWKTSAEIGIFVRGSHT